MMHALIAFALGPVGRYVALGCALLAGLYAVIWNAERAGADRAMAQIERINSNNRNRADQGQQQAIDCAATWNRRTGKCE